MPEDDTTMQPEHLAARTAPTFSTLLLIVALGTWSNGVVGAAMIQVLLLMTGRALQATAVGGMAPAPAILAGRLGQAKSAPA